VAHRISLLNLPALVNNNPMNYLINLELLTKTTQLLKVSIS